MLTGIAIYSWNSSPLLFRESQNQYPGLGVINYIINCITLHMIEELAFGQIGIMMDK